MTATIQPAEGTTLVYQCALLLPRQALTFVAGLLGALCRAKTLHTA